MTKDPRCCAGGRPGGEAVFEGKTVEVAAIVTGQLGDEGGAQVGAKLQNGLMVARQLKAVFTKIGCPSAPSTSSWALTSPVVKQAAGT